ncbi:single-stranded-DNA-specific exonuclease RecJ [Fluoribacter dumoffii]|uniref:Single-stranded-DNA-specific exonuclease RecJ n=1 Tax=Fluoribacter dumoffii TaxID=463 RepID=A0A377GA89_9GAMM|nr:single-stranded-DNA-specific exonuclease RecJ [Fluoribacter dumoffii]KTC93526.1 Single-stranded-DNA-specific exonuclease RecJ [Fluoribacter dumoffii NY 23]MCW8385725.1 single-stranded-DNA-specific exonuclease RecJ [Fluoribacter dumoffii]MCW8418755.1 single-stranded-DNA-specific exonuclease RecJ [Fluoribacter dumoffii]MCW8453401.1 single-stranded-DNA-specific exonuclease RecJ [Fluoribacter dumoffii]MCW8459379.1 single-stranded-DNA-specific exonuclease RecJ [Fluoribacter dumoffii]
MLIKQRPIPAEIPDLPNIPDVLRRIFANRGITEPCQLDKQLQTLLPFESFKGIKEACIRLEKALREQQRILIIGDFDADGATSTALAITALRTMGAQFVDYLVPNRFEFGYGLTPQIVEVASKWKPALIITVDNGIASVEGVERANQLGIDVLITDHHLPADTLPNACAIVNPNQQGCNFPSKSIAGVGVIFYVMLALRRHLVNTHWFHEMNIKEPNMASFLDLVALGTVADVVGLDQNNRIMVNQGLARIRQGLCREGIKALIEVSGRDYARLRESDLGFAIAPRLNAAGRLDDMSLGIECLITSDRQQARNYCQQLDELNEERKQIETEMKEQAMLALEKLTLSTEYNKGHLPIALCLFDKTWHQGVIGILAGRMKERYHRPVIAFAQVSEHELKGSARSVSDLNIRDVLAAIDKDNPGLITKFGGHAMAAGLSIHPDSFKAFSEALVSEVNKHIDVSQCEGELLTDGPLHPEEFSIEIAQLIQQAGPWGQQFAEPVFDNVFEVLDQRLVGKNHLKMTLATTQGEQQVDAIAFNIDLKSWPNHRVKWIHAAYKLDINFYQGRTRLQLLIQAMNVVNQE